MSDRFKVIVSFDAEKIIERVIDFGDWQAGKSAFNLDEASTKIFSNGLNLAVGFHVDLYTDDGGVKPFSELFELGLLKLEDDEKLLGEEIVKLTEVEMFQKYPNKEEYKTKVIETDNAGTDFLREMTELEKLNANIITAEVYDSYIETIRLNFYRQNQDVLRSDLANDLSMSATQREIKEATISALDKTVREKYQFSKDLIND